MKLRRRERQVEEKSEIEAIIRQCDVCRLAFADNNIPYIVTMNFGYSPQRQCFYFHSACEGRKLSFMSKNNYVCFEMDTGHMIIEAERACDWGMEYSSIVGYGRLNTVDCNVERKYGLDTILSHYSDSNEFIYNESVFVHTMVLRLDIEDISGKRNGNMLNATV
ncbi:MAG: pyridoxamine 5'-phosphate oxidase family protein [Bacteroidales bacterium]|jgi:nitroimidazol reductase NimA-like FMN-containing flavoprotein (pyridoxamine 5'-phosphate oxidase superfamily)|nr:pyridoxamine 5'-phosphate oxidase family protein [Bacteroidales bacterium]